MEWWQEVVVAAAAFAAGLINSIAGGGTLLSFPALIWLGRDFLILFATLLVAVQEPISQRLGRAEGERPSRAWWVGAIVFQFLVGVYGGYFGAGIGILMLAALGLLGFADIHRMNALKNVLAICINGVAALYFILSGAVIWVDVLVMTFAAIAGGYSGARLAYRLGRRFVRYAVIAIGLVMGVSLFFN
ncbi:MAG: sulfite exporter TauE/SafE family protein [Acidobacteria bacterium]|nr:sulfite exporter TauE/SafE family protein [Acidobacteriota bacterium]